MNVAHLRSYIGEYKRVFDSISTKEIYKWQAVKTFQSEWNADERDFANMLNRALSRTGNLMDSGNYFPRRMILRIASRRPKAVRSAFLELFDEEAELLGRIRAFRMAVKKLNRDLRIGKNDFQDDRAALVYLCMKYPESYYLYKYGMLKKACEALAIQYSPKTGAEENIVQYLSLCQFVRDEIKQDDELLILHKGRLSQTEYGDPALTLLTQDLIYAITEYLPPSAAANDPPGSIEFAIPPTHVDGALPSAGAAFVDYAGIEQRRRHLGVLGELLVVERERTKHGNRAVTHVSQALGDGAGYDIRSIEDDGSTVYIEVKTTTGSQTTPFEVTRNELAFSEENAELYRLYRLYEFDALRNRAKCFVIRGSLKRFCDCPTRYRVHFGDRVT